MKLHQGNKRGLTSLDWLTSYHSFSFGDYYAPDKMSYRTLRVINDDVIAPGGGFGTHGHRDMEIVSFVLSGALAHRDSMGHEEVLRPGEVQVMSAGRGIEHSEFNPSPTEATHLFQIWITPERRGLVPAYQQHPFRVEDRTNRLLRVAGPKRDHPDGALLIHQDADLYVTRLEPGAAIQHTIQAGRGAWVHVMKGKLTINGQELSAGDALEVDGPTDLSFVGGKDVSEIFCFDLR